MSELAIQRWLSKVDLEPVFTYGAMIFWWRDEEIIQINDVFDDDNLAQALAMHPTAKFVISDTYTQFVSQQPTPVHCVPLASAGVMPGLLAEGFEPVDEADTQYCFNFVINKKRLNRFYLLKILEHFDLMHRCNYTYSGAGTELNDEPWCKNYQHDLELAAVGQALDIVSRPVEVTAKWFSAGNPFYHHDPTDNKLMWIQDNGGNGAAWNAGLGRMIAHSAVSLITESLGVERATVLTEKTFYSALALTFPIWIGGYQQAKLYQYMGFDIFEDVIDHSYQNHTSLFDRCYHAVNDNIKLLSDLDLAKNLRNKYRHRLRMNQQLAMNNQPLLYCRKVLTNLPGWFTPTWQQFMRENFTPYL